MKKVWKGLAVLLLAALLAGSGYLLYDYTRNPEKYDDLDKQVSDKLTGRDQYTVEEVSPERMPEMTLPLDTNYYFPSMDDQGRMMILCCGKDQHGDLHMPLFWENLTYEKAYLASAGGQQEITDQLRYDEAQHLLTVDGALMDSLEPGEYYFLPEFRKEDGGPIALAYGLILEETSTFHSPQRGYVPIHDPSTGWITNDLAEPRDITLTFYNLADNPIRGLQVNRTEVDPEKFVISERGDQVTLKKEYLQRLNPNTVNQYMVRLANGELLELGPYAVLGTVDGDSLHRLTFEAPETYSKSRGGDFVIKLNPGDCEKYFLLKLVWLDEQGTTIFEEKAAASLYLHPEAGTIVLPEELMQSLEPHEQFGYGVYVDYLACDMVLDDSMVFHVVP